MNSISLGNFFPQNISIEVLCPFRFIITKQSLDGFWWYEWSIFWFKQRKPLRLKKKRKCKETNSFLLRLSKRFILQINVAVWRKRSLRRLVWFVRDRTLRSFFNDVVSNFEDYRSTMDTAACGACWCWTSPTITTAWFTLRLKSNKDNLQPHFRHFLQPLKILLNHKILIVRKLGFHSRLHPRIQTSPDPNVLEFTNFSTL